MSRTMNNYLMLGENNPDIAAQQAEMNKIQTNYSQLQMAMADSMNKNQFFKEFVWFF